MSSGYQSQQQKFKKLSHNTELICCILVSSQALRLRFSVPVIPGFLHNHSQKSTAAELQPVLFSFFLNLGMFGLSGTYCLLLNISLCPGSCESVQRAREHSQQEKGKSLAL